MGVELIPEGGRGRRRGRERGVPIVLLHRHILAVAGDSALPLLVLVMKDTGLKAHRGGKVKVIYVGFEQLLRVHLLHDRIHLLIAIATITTLAIGIL